MAHADFVHLRVHSAYSLSEGAIKNKQLVDLCKRNSMPAVAVTDTGNLFGAMEFSGLAKDAGVQPIIGCQLGLARDRDPHQMQIPVPDQIVLLVQNGSAEAFERLVVRWTPRLLRYAVRMLGLSPDTHDDARDLVQETWVSAVTGVRRLRDPKAFPAWIYGVATRRCADLIRSRARRRRLHAAAAAEYVPEYGALPSDTALDVAEAIRRLPAMHRAVVHLFYREELSLEAIASILDVPVGTVKSRLHNARRALKLLLGAAVTIEQSMKEDFRE